MEKNLGGRPLKFKSVEELSQKIDGYFASLYDYARDMWGNRLKDKDYKKPKDGSDDDNPHAGFVMKKVKVATVTGLAVFLDTTRDTLLDYESGKYDDHDASGEAVELNEEQREWNEQVDRFSDTIKRAKLMILDDTEQQLFLPGKSTGAIFSLKVNYEWQDKTITEISNPDGTLASPLQGIDSEDLRQFIKNQKKA